MLSNLFGYMFCESPPILGWSEDILSKPISGFDPRLQKHNDILLTNYQKSSIINLTRKQKEKYIIYLYIIYS